MTFAALKYLDIKNLPLFQISFEEPSFLSSKSRATNLSVSELTSDMLKHTMCKMEIKFTGRLFG
jgi:hypothetical protein